MAIQLEQPFGHEVVPSPATSTRSRALPPTRLSAFNNFGVSLRCQRCTRAKMSGMARGQGGGRPRTGRDAHIFVRVTPALKARVDAYCQDNGVRPVDTLERWIEQGLAEEQPEMPRSA